MNYLWIKEYTKILNIEGNVVTVGFNISFSEYLELGKCDSYGEGNTK